MNLGELLRLACERHASDLVLVAGAPPTIWVAGRMTPLCDPPRTLIRGQVERLFEPVLNGPGRDRLARTGDLDYACPLEQLITRATGPGQDAPAQAAPAQPAAGEDWQNLADGLGRVRVNLHRQRGDVAAAVRFIPRKVPSLGSLNLPAAVGGWINLPRGLVLVTGPTGAGKSTTLAAMVQQANQHRACHVVTLEDPIEYEFEHGRCLIEQRQIGDDCPSFAHALRHVVRQRPDVILVGEMRDRETISAALTAAETGHLVLATLHTSSASATLARIIDAFDERRQEQIRLQLAGCLQCILCQNLLPDRLTGGLIPVTEVLTANTAIRRAIRDRQEHQIGGMLETGQAAGMHGLEQDLSARLAEGRISYDDAIGLTSDPERLQRRLGGVKA